MSQNCLKRLSFSEVEDKLGDDITYGDLLQTSEWCKKREEILIRDNRKCQSCGKNETINLGYGKHGKIEFEIIISEILEVHEIEPVLVSADEPVILHVHHKFYILNTLPWEYDNSSLVTLCHECHDQVHQVENIPVYLSNGEQIDGLSYCPKCNGTGYLPQYRHFHDGICFRCNGNRFTKTIYLSQ